VSPAALRSRPLRLVAALLSLAGSYSPRHLAFAYVGGWLTPDRLTPGRMVAALSDRGGNPLGHRRNHSKGMCFTGVFDANGLGSPYSTAPGRYPGSRHRTGRIAR
jgi:catalase